MRPSFIKLPSAPSGAFRPRKRLFIMAICLYDQHDTERREAYHREYVTADGFAALERSADQRGYRKATISEIHASAESRPGAEELFCWRGGLWVQK